MKKGKYPAQTADEIVSDLVENKEKQMSRSRGQALYPKERTEIVDDTITRLVGMGFEQMGEFATAEHISLADTNELKKRTLIYLKACEQNAVFPSVSGLARVLGYSRRELNNWMTKHQGTETAKWLDSFSDMCAETLHQAALTKHTSEITTIFLSKALYGLTETSNLVLSQRPPDLPNEIDEDALRAEYEQYAKQMKESENNENENEII